MAPAEITLVPRDPLAPTPVVLVERQQVTTISVVASSTPSGMGGPSTEPEKKGFPIAVAIPALVGGMAAAIAAFGIWWWCHKRSKRERRVSIQLSHQVRSMLRCSQERWEAAQRRKQRQRANSAGRPSMGTTRSTSGSNLKNMAEKDVVPPVPALPKHYPPSSDRVHAEKQQHQYGYGYQQPQDHYSQQQYGHAHNQYSTQPTIEENPTSPTYSDNSSGSNAYSSSSAGSSTPLVKEPKKTSPTKSGSRSVARMAVADSAAATAGLDPNVRYQPKKPSPLALKAQEKLNARNEWADGPFRSNNAGPEETLDDGTHGPSQAQHVGREVMSGEWGVALGSPNHDPSASFADQQASAMSGNQSRYSNDPYLAANAKTRAPSGQYSNDPYAGYHDPVVNSNGKKSNWV